MLKAARLTSMAATTAALTVLHSPESFAKHVTPSYHPECRSRTDAAAVEGLRSLLKAPSPTFEEALEPHPRVDVALGRVHGEAYLGRLAEPVEATQLRALDEDTFLSAGSFEATKLATSLWLYGVDAVLETQQDDVAFAFSRPPGHHAGASTACGFCTLNHAAAAAAYALDSVDCVAVLDVDVHFGNGVASIFGTNSLFSTKGRARYASIHQHPAYPFSGTRGAEALFGGDSAKEVLKFVPVLPETDGRTWLRKLQEDALPFLEDLRPDLLVVCAGFDALDSDPLAQLQLTNSDFAHAATAIRRSFPDIPIVAGLEGGYDVDALPAAIAAFLDGLVVKPSTTTTTTTPNSEEPSFSSATPH